MDNTTRGSRMFTCVQKLRKQGSNEIYMYILKEANGNVIKVTPEQLKFELQRGSVTVDNLKLTKDNRLISVVPKYEEYKSNTDPIDRICYLVNNMPVYLANLKIAGTIDSNDPEQLALRQVYGNVQAEICALMNRAFGLEIKPVNRATRIFPSRPDLVPYGCGNKLVIFTKDYIAVANETHSKTTGLFPVPDENVIDRQAVTNFANHLKEGCKQGDRELTYIDFQTCIFNVLTKLSKDNNLNNAEYISAHDINAKDAGRFINATEQYKITKEKNVLLTITRKSDTNELIYGLIRGSKVNAEKNNTAILNATAMAKAINRSLAGEAYVSALTKAVYDLIHDFFLTTVKITRDNIATNSLSEEEKLIGSVLVKLAEENALDVYKFGIRDYYLVRKGDNPSRSDARILWVSLSKNEELYGTKLFRYNGKDVSGELNVTSMLSTKSSKEVIKDLLKELDIKVKFELCDDQDKMALAAAKIERDTPSMDIGFVSGVNDPENDMRQMHNFAKMIQANDEKAMKAAIDAVAEKQSESTLAENNDDNTTDRDDQIVETVITIDKLFNHQYDTSVSKEEAVRDLHDSIIDSLNSCFHLHLIKLNIQTNPKELIPLSNTNEVITVAALGSQLLVLREDGVYLENPHIAYKHGDNASVYSHATGRVYHGLFASNNRFASNNVKVQTNVCVDTLKEFGEYLYGIEKNNNKNSRSTVEYAFHSRVIQEILLRMADAYNLNVTRSFKECETYTLTSKFNSQAKIEVYRDPELLDQPAYTFVSAKGLDKLRFSEFVDLSEWGSIKRGNGKTTTGLNRMQYKNTIVTKAFNQMSHFVDSSVNS